IVDEQRLQRFDAGFTQVGQHGLCDLVVGVGDDFAGFRVDDGFREHTAHEVVIGYGNVGDTGVGEVAQMLGIDTLFFLDDDLAVAVGDVEPGHFTLPAFGNEFKLAAFGQQVEVVEVEEVGEDSLRRHADGFQQDGDRHFAATGDTEEQDVFGVELEVEPGPAVRNHAGREQELAGTVGFTAVVFEKHARGTVQLRHNDALGTVDDKRTV